MSAPLPATEAELAAIAARLPPYAHALNISVSGIDHGAPVLVMKPRTRVRGRPGFIHGGALSGLLEMAAIATVMAELARRAALPGAAPMPRMKPVNISLAFQRGATMDECFATGHITRAGRRIVNVTAEAWQADREKPVATAWLNILLVPPKG